MAITLQKMVVLTGFMEAATLPLAIYLESRGFPILFENQNIDLTVYEANGRILYDQWRQNIEVLRINEGSLQDNNMTWHRPLGALRRVISPTPFLERFPDKVLVHDPRCCLTFGMWASNKTRLIFVDSDIESLLPTLQDLYGLNADYWRWLHNEYHAAIRPQLPRGLVLQHADILRDVFWKDRVDAFLGSE